MLSSRAGPCQRVRAPRKALRRCAAPSSRQHRSPSLLLLLAAADLTWEQSLARRSRTLSAHSLPLGRKAVLTVLHGDLAAAGAFSSSSSRGLLLAHELGVKYIAQRAHLQNPDVEIHALLPLSRLKRPEERDASTRAARPLSPSSGLSSSRQPCASLSDLLRSPTRADEGGALAIGSGGGRSGGC